jgi:signal transduction histidine kinase
MRIILFTIIFVGFSYAKILNISNIQNYKSTDYIFYLSDNKYIFQDILNNNNMLLLEKTNLKTSIESFWTKITIKNDTNDFKQIVLYNHLSGMNIIDVYLIKNNKLNETLHLGDLREQKLRNILNRHSSFILQLKPNEEVTVISKLENYLIYNLNWEITNLEDFINEEFKILFLFGIFGGLLILFLIYNVLSYLIYKKIEYIIICCITFSVLCYQYGFNGILYFLNININLEIITAITWNTTSLVALFLSLFSITFFKLWKNYRKFFWCSLFFVFTSASLVLLVIYAQFINNYLFHYYYLILVNIFILISYLNILGIYMLIKKEKSSLYYLIGNVILFIAVIFNTMGVMGIVDYQEKLKYFVPLSYIIDMLSMLISIYLKNKSEQKELRNTKILLLEQANFSSIGQAIGHISHQWKNPLTKIGTLITLLETISEHKLEELNKTFKDKLPLIKNSIEIMKKSIDEFSNFYMVKKDYEYFHPIACIENVLEILNSKIVLKEVSINLEISPDLEIKSFEHIWSNIFLVLIDNSLDAFTSNITNKYIYISCNKNQDSVEIKYIDSAGGIKIKPIVSVFDYFVSFKENGNSSGLGLAVVKMLINDRLKGEINVINYEKGVKFTIKLPTNE